MLDIFKTKNNKDDIIFHLLEEKYINSFNKKYSNNKFLLGFFNEYGGASYDKGLFKIHSKNSSYYWTNLLNEFFPDYKNKICCFSYDWMGCQYGIDLEKNNKIYLFDPALMKVFEIEHTLIDFFNEELVHYKEETLDTETFVKLINEKGLSLLPLDKCFGFKKLLFLGGEDELYNLEICDIEIYWEMNYQVYCKIKKLDEGSVINKFDFE